MSRSRSRLARRERCPGLAQDPQDPRVERALENVLELGHHRSRGADRGLDGAGFHPGRADLRAVERGTDEPGTAPTSTTRPRAAAAPRRGASSSVASRSRRRAVGPCPALLQATRHAQDTRKDRASAPLASSRGLPVRTAPYGSVQFPRRASRAACPGPHCARGAPALCSATEWLHQHRHLARGQLPAVRERLEELRPAEGRGRRLALDPEGRVLLAARPERLRQDHAAADPGRASRRPTPGACSLDGQDITDLPPNRRKVNTDLPELRAVPAPDACARTSPSACRSRGRPRPRSTRRSTDARPDPDEGPGATSSPTSSAAGRSSASPSPAR